MRYLFQRNAILAIVVISSWTSLRAQSYLKAGFDKMEYMEFLRLHGGIYDGMGQNKLPEVRSSKLIYRSAVTGLDNRWDLWKTDDHVFMINLRGTTTNPVGWLENFYAAMAPATGELKLTRDYTFKYKLAENPRAAVHIGFLIGMAFLARDIVPKIDSCYKSGARDFIIAGHSQGGALSYLLTSYLYQLRQENLLPKDIRFKTYSSASPKAGNSYYAYEYENMVAGGWGYNVVNAADWVPETPFSVQVLGDFNTTNPFTNIDTIMKKQKLITRLALRHAYKRLRKPSEKTQRNYERYLGNFAGKQVLKTLPDYEAPVYTTSSNYVRIGPTVILLPDEAYYKIYPDSGKNVFMHHLLDSYYFLAAKYPH
ncbi:hypothetical protein DYBT9275_01259 [Dyadobacter sp. CECT 9275]|uniref:Fungal lipase-type domain-containing protein n=1 Tax=Dyadobacter helix TaxID=2822344 RepID=A0A916NB00_9BACT|nr:lipase family protein [Dyadobacter sp. CECT 9275]CAG4993907.1 hypothetical protein DYBT9275_01259 [Dyadobacter sp. CECT 9275]